MRKIVVMIAALVALSAGAAMAEETTAPATANEPTTPAPAEITAPAQTTTSATLVEPSATTTAEQAKRKTPIREVFTPENVAEAGFGAAYEKAIVYEKAYDGQGKQLTPWTSRTDVLNEKNVFGWRKAALRRNNSAVYALVYAPRIGWSEFVAASANATPEGWEMTLEPRDKKLAGFDKIIITADQADIRTFEIR